MEVNNFDLIGFDLFGVDLNSIDINTDSSISVKDDYIPTTIKPYIKGHVTDSSSTFTFLVNNSDSITVDVGSDGWWKWNVDRDITNLIEAFKDITNLDECYLYNIDTTGSCNSMFSGCTKLTKLTLDCSLSNNSTMRAFFNGKNERTNFVCKNVIFDKIISGWRGFCVCDSIVGLEKATFESCTDGYQMFADYRGETLDLQSACFDKLITANQMFNVSASNSNLKNLNIKKIGISISFSGHKLLSEQSVVNLFNAVCNDGITLTFHSTIGAMIDAQLEINDSPIYTAYWNKYDEGIEINYTY